MGCLIKLLTAALQIATYVQSRSLRCTPGTKYYGSCPKLLPAALFRLIMCYMLTISGRWVRVYHETYESGVNVYIQFQDLSSHNGLLYVATDGSREKYVTGDIDQFN